MDISNYCKLITRNPPVVFWAQETFLFIWDLFWLSGLGSVWGFWGSSTKIEQQNNALASFITQWHFSCWPATCSEGFICWKKKTVCSWVNKCFDLIFRECCHPLWTFMLIITSRCFSCVATAIFKSDPCSFYLHQTLASLLIQGSPAAPWRNRIHKAVQESQLSDFATRDWKKAIFEHPRLQNLKACACCIYYHFHLDAILEYSMIFKWFRFLTLLNSHSKTSELQI